MPARMPAKRPKLRALVLALAVAACAVLPAVPAAPALAAPRAAAAVRIVGPVRLMRLMLRNWWCERTVPGRFRCTNADVDPYLNVVALNRNDLWWELRHDYECTGGGADVGYSWDGTPD